MSWRTQRVDVLDGVVAVCGPVGVVAKTLALASDGGPTLALVLLLPVVLAVSGVVLFSGWWNLERTDYHALPEATGRWRIVRRVLPAACLATGALIVGGNTWRIVAADEDWVTRYLTGAFGVVVGCIAIGHGVMRIRASRQLAPVDISA